MVIGSNLIERHLPPDWECIDMTTPMARKRNVIGRARQAPTRIRTKLIHSFLGGLLTGNRDKGDGSRPTTARLSSLGQLVTFAISDGRESLDRAMAWVDTEAEQRGLIHWTEECARTLGDFEHVGSALAGEGVDQLDGVAVAASRSFRLLSRVLRSLGKRDDALACALSAVNLAAWSDEGPACVDLALELLADLDDADNSLVLKARQADILVRRCVADPTLVLPAFDAVESLVRHRDDFASEHLPLLLSVAERAEATGVLTGIAPVLAAMLPTDDAVADQANLLFSSVRWVAPGSVSHEVSDRFIALGVSVERARMSLEQQDDADAAAAKWATWSFDYPPFRRAVPLGRSAEREVNPDEMLLTIVHETIHVLSMMSGVGVCVAALRAALLEIELRLWVSVGFVDPEALSSVGVAPLAGGDLDTLARTEAALEITRKLQILQDVWAPWLEGLAVFGELGACSADDDFSSLLTNLLMNLNDGFATRRLIEEEGKEILTGEAALERRLAEAEEAYARAVRGQTSARLITLLTSDSERYLAGYVAVRSVVASWRAIYPEPVNAQMAFRVLLHATRFGTEDAVPDLGLSVGAFRKQAITRLETWVSRLVEVTVEELAEFDKPDAGRRSMEWRDGRLIDRTGDGEPVDTQTRETFAERRAQAIRSVAGIGDSDGVPMLSERILARAAILPIGQARSPFWLVPEAGRLFVLLCTNEHDPEADRPRHQLVATKLPEERLAALDCEMRARRDGRILVTRVATLHDGSDDREAPLAGLHYLVFSYGNWMHVQPAGVAFDADQVLSAPPAVAERVQPDALLDFESEVTAEGRVGARRTLDWIRSVETWGIEGGTVDAGGRPARVEELATEVLGDSRGEIEEASRVLLELVGGGLPADLYGRGLKLLERQDPTWVEMVADVLAASSSGPVGSECMDVHAEEARRSIGALLVLGEGGWDVRQIGTEER
jgi:hypothetical protein